MLALTGRRPHQISESGKRIKNYVFEYSDLIGKGNFARVYRGIDTNTQATVAVKVVSLDALRSKRLQELVFQEIRILQQLSHPNVVRFYEALLSDRNCYIVTELCNEGDLEEKIRRKGGLAEGEISKLIVDLYQGLRYLRQVGVTHRDLKAANIFMHNGVAKIADFGLAKLYKERFKDLDIGSPLYMSPQGLIHQCYGQKTDIWAFGVVIYEMIHVETPFAFCQTEAQLKSNVLKPLPIGRFKKCLSSGYKQLIYTLLQPNQNKRPSIFELAGQPYIRALLQGNFEGSLKKRTQIPLINLNQSLSSKVQGKIQLVNRPVSSHNQKIMTHRPIAQMQNETIRKEEKKNTLISPQSLNVQLGGLKNSSHITIKIPSQSFYKPHGENLKPSSVSFEKKSIPSQLLQPSQHLQHPHLHYQLLKQRQFSQKTIETKESEQEKGYFLKGEYSSSQPQFNN